MSTQVIVTLTIHVPRPLAQALAYQPRRVEAWLREVGLWPEEEGMAVYWCIDPVSQGLVMTHKVPVPVDMERVGYEA